ncbi:MAG: A/G-specific adenine glycosylase [Lachnospiraceae bacterium]|nr:A/G-specific adenine glycosylase [Lachnospiraceae bacterium]
MRFDFVKPMLVWYNENARDLPWRRTKDPYLIWVSEIMLQQTRVEAVLGYYERFTSALPTVTDLALCPEDRLLKLWEGLGYYSRARNMQKAARIVCESYAGQMPESAADLMKLPGIGEYTAGAISSIAFGQAEPAVDGNVLRVVARLEAISDNILNESVKKKIREELRGLYDANDGTFGLLNQAFMDLGAGVCLAGSAPKCDICPISSYCRCFELGLQSELPVRVKKQKRRIEKRTVLLLHRDETYAIRKRPDSGLLSGLYEFPNETGELSSDDALGKAESLGLMPLRIKKLSAAKHIFSHVEWHMTGYEILVAPSGFPDAGELQDAGDLSHTKENVKENPLIFATPEMIESKYPVPSAFEKYAKMINIRTGKNRGELRYENINSRDTEL